MSQSSGTLRLAVVLGLLSCVGPFAIDMYLPALPAIAADLGATVTNTQATLTSFFIAFGVSQLIYGPLADQFGRKPPLYAGLIIFVLATLGCAFAPSIGWLTAFRFLQGVGGAVVMVIPRAVIRDLHTGPAATRLMALVMLVISISPMLAPLAGSGLIALFSWQAIFIFLVMAALCSLLLTLFLLPETLHEEYCMPFNAASQLRGTRMLLRDPMFMGLTFIGGFGIGSFFVFIASASFVYTQQFGLSPTGFSLAFAFNALAFFGASQLAAPLQERFGSRKLVSLSVSGFAFFCAALWLLALAGFASLPVIVGFLFLANGCLGFVFPTTMVMALDGHGEHAGLASSIGGTLQMLAGSVMIALAGPFFDGTATPMLGAMALCAVIAYVLMRILVTRRLQPAGTS
jgi:DHA1 family bicyclomycin/chloramphenicol resistance-like MFS transporter